MLIIRVRWYYLFNIDGIIDSADEKTRSPEPKKSITEPTTGVKAYVGSIIGNKLRHVINKTATKWIDPKPYANKTLSANARPSTTEKIEAKRVLTNTVQKDSISNNRTNASTGWTGSKKKHR